MTHTKCLFFIGHSLHPHTTCFSLVMAYAHALLAFHLLQFKLTQFLFLIGHGLHPCNACFSLAMIYTHTILILHWSQLIPTHCLFSGNHSIHLIKSQMYLSTTSTRFITGQGDLLHLLTKKKNE